jgi:hypothetical protein
VEHAYKNAVAVADQDWFNLDSPRQQLKLLRELGFRLAPVEAALKVLKRAMDGLQPPERPLQPGQVVLFSGHMIDQPGRVQPRFPADKEAIAAQAIEDTLTALNVLPGDLGLCGGANGGDLLFAEACLRRSMRLELRIPSEEPRFLRNSVTFAGDQWRDRFYAVKGHKNTQLFVMTDELGPAPAGVDPYARNNLWQLYSALVWGEERLRFVCLWDGQGGDGLGGTQHVFEAARARTSHVYHLNTTRLFGLMPSA